MRNLRLLSLALPAVFAAGLSLSPASAGSASGVGVVPQGLQPDTAYAASYQTAHVTNVDATTQQTSCYTPEVQYAATLAPQDGYSQENACPGATTGEALGPYPTQAGSNPGFGVGPADLVKDHSESDIRVDPTNPRHLIGQSKWFVSPEGYNHVLGFYESFDGGKTWPLQGHVPGYEGWTDNTDPVGAFDSFGNFYSLLLDYQFFYNSDGSHNFQTNQNKEPNPSVPAEVIAVAVRPHGGTTATQWLTIRNGATDVVAAYPAKGREPDKQWISIDTNPSSPHFNRIYAMWTVFDSFSAVPFVSFADARADGSHTDWSAPLELPTAGSNPQGDTFLLPHVDGDGNVYTTLTNFEPNGGFCCTSILLDRSTDGGLTWTSVSRVIDEVSAPPLLYANTQFRDGIENTFTVGPNRINGHFPLYVSWEDKSAGVGNVILSASYNGGSTWSSPIQVNDNASAVDAFQPNLTAAADGTVSDAFYDRRLACPQAGTADAQGAGLAKDTVNLNFSGTLPPYGISNYCVNSTIQFYDGNLHPLGHNTRTSAHTWDPQLNEPRPAGLNAAEGFIGDYYGNVTSGSTDYTTSVSTFDDGTNPQNRQQQIVATIAVP